MKKLIKNFKIKAVVGVGFGVVALFLLCCLYFILLLTVFTINSLSEIGGSSFYIEHTVYNYFIVFLGLLLLKVGNK